MGGNHNSGTTFNSCHQEDGMKSTLVEGNMWRIRKDDDDVESWNNLDQVQCGLKLVFIA